MGYDIFVNIIYDHHATSCIGHQGLAVAEAAQRLYGNHAISVPSLQPLQKKLYEARAEDAWRSRDAQAATVPFFIESTENHVYAAGSARGFCRMFVWKWCNATCNMFTGYGLMISEICVTP